MSSAAVLVQSSEFRGVGLGGDFFGNKVGFMGRADAGADDQCAVLFKLEISLGPGHPPQLLKTTAAGFSRLPDGHFTL